jgi:hypothetical protein
VHAAWFLTVSVLDEEGVPLERKAKRCSARERRDCGGFVQEPFDHALCVLQSGPVSITPRPQDNSTVSTESDRAVGLRPHFSNLPPVNGVF